MENIIEIAQPFLLGPVSLIPLIIAVVQAVKEFGWLRGKQLRLLAIGLGWPLLALSLLIERGLLGANAVLVCEIVIVSAWGVFGPSGLYALGKQFLENQDPGPDADVFPLSDMLERIQQ